VHASRNAVQQLLICAVMLRFESDSIMQVEKLLDRRLGPVPSMAVRMLLGLVGCTACTAAFPFLPATHQALLWVVAVLGMVSCGWSFFRGL
jgi:hypothetical protein